MVATETNNTAAAAGGKKVKKKLNKKLKKKGEKANVDLTDVSKKEDVADKKNGEEELE